MKTKIISFCLAVTLLLSFLTLTGCKNRSKEFVTLETCSEEQMLIYRAIYEETGFNPVVDASNYSAEEKVYTDVTVNFAYSVGFGRYRILSLEEFEDIQRYQNETGKQVLYPIVNPKCRMQNDTENNTIAEADIQNANIYYLTKIIDNKTVPVFSADGNLIPNYWKYEAGQETGAMIEYNSLRIEGENGIQEDGKQYFYVYGRYYGSLEAVEVRLFFYEYYQYLKSKDYVSEKTFFDWYSFRNPT